MIDWKASISGAAKCLNPWRRKASPTIADARLALCADCKSSTIYKWGQNRLLVCGTLGLPGLTLEPPTCGCIVGGCDGVMTADAERCAMNADDRDRTIRFSVVPLCKTELLSEACPQGKWLSRSCKPIADTST